MKEFAHLIKKKSNQFSDLKKKLNLFCILLKQLKRFPQVLDNQKKISILVYKFEDIFAIFFLTVIFFSDFLIML